MLQLARTDADEKPGLAFANQKTILHSQPAMQHPPCYPHMQSCPTSICAVPCCTILLLQLETVCSPTSKQGHSTADITLSVMFTKLLVSNNGLRSTPQAACTPCTRIHCNDLSFGSTPMQFNQFPTLYGTVVSIPYLKMVILCNKSLHGTDLAYYVSFLLIMFSMHATSLHLIPVFSVKHNNILPCVRQATRRMIGRQNLEPRSSLKRVQKL